MNRYLVTDKFDEFLEYVLQTNNVKALKTMSENIGYDNPELYEFKASLDCVTDYDLKNDTFRICFKLFHCLDNIEVIKFLSDYLL